MKPTTSLALVLVLVAGIVGVVACSPSKTTTENNGVDDVKAACELRVSWKNADVDKCKNCLASAAQPACDCEAFRDYGGKCHDQNVARQREPDCSDPVIACANSCAKNDCACLDGCYATAAKCRAAASAVDGCVANVCGPYCQ